jgi:hypothetical protein
MKGIQACSIKGPGPLQRGDNRKNGVGSFKNLLKNYMYEARKADFYMKTFLHRTKASWLKSWLPLVGWGKWKRNAYLILEKNIFIWAKVSQVSDVAHGPLVCLIVLSRSSLF